MYKILLPTGQALELPVETQLGFELQSSIFSSTDVSVLPGSFTFPLDIKSSPANRIALGFPENVHTPGIPAPIEGVWVYAYGLAMFYGTLTIRASNTRRISVSIVANPIASIKDKKLNELDLGEDVDFSAYEALMVDTVENPQDYNYAFLPVENLSFRPDDAPGVFASAFIKAQNTWDYAGSFEFDPDVPIMPMVRLDYLLRQLIETSAEGWSLQNDLQATQEMQQLYLWNNYDLYIGEEGNATKFLAPSFNLKNHVSDTKGNEFLKKIHSLFCCGVFTNPFNRTIKIIPLQEILQRPARHDWTAYAVEPDDINFEDNDAIDLFHHLTDSIGARSTNASNPEFDPATYNLSDTLEELTAYDNTFDFNAAAPAVGLYYIEDIAGLMLRRDAGGGFFENVVIGFKKRVKRLDTAENEYQPSIQVPHRLGDTVRWDAAGNMVVEDDATAVTWKRTNEKMTDVVFFYRGLQLNINDELVPYCTDADFPPDETAAPGNIYDNGTIADPVQYSLRWTGDRGLYATRFALWNELIANGKTVPMQLTLPVAKLVDFSFEDKIRIHNMEYFVKSLRIKELTPDGIFVIDTKLFTTI